MTQQFAAPEPELGPAHEPFYVRLGDAFVIVSATVMSLAAGAWLIARLELDLSYAILAALGAYCGLLLLHLLMRRSMMDRDDTAEEWGEDDDIHWQTGAAAFEAALSREDAPSERSPSGEDEEKPAARSSLWSSALPMPEAAPVTMATRPSNLLLTAPPLAVPDPLAARSRGCPIPWVPDPVGPRLRGCPHPPSQRGRARPQRRTARAGPADRGATRRCGSRSAAAGRVPSPP